MKSRIIPSKTLKTMVLFFLALFALFPISASAKTLKASIAEMPKYAEKQGSESKGVLVDLVRAIAKESGNTIDISVAPFKRSMHNVQNKKADFHLPLIKVPNVNEAQLPYRHSTETIFHVNFVLYTNKNKSMNINNPDNYSIETDAAHVQYFAFAIQPSYRIEGSLKKLNIGRIDGFIFADNATDPIIKKLNLRNIKRQLYKVFDVKIILPNGEDGKKMDSLLTQAITALREKGAFKKIMEPIDLPYDNWQP